MLIASTWRTRPVAPNSNEPWTSYSVHPAAAHTKVVGTNELYPRATLFLCKALGCGISSDKLTTCTPAFAAQDALQGYTFTLQTTYGACTKGWQGKKPRSTRWVCVHTCPRGRPRARLESVHRGLNPNDDVPRRAGVRYQSCGNGTRLQLWQPGTVLGPARRRFLKRGTESGKAVLKLRSTVC